MFVNCPPVWTIVKLVLLQLAPVQKTCAKPKNASLLPLLFTALETILLALEKTSWADTKSGVAVK